MLLKKPTIALCSISNLPTSLGLPHSITSSSLQTPPPPTESSRRIRPRWPQPRGYASVHQPKNDKGSPQWPSSANPTPYEVFGQTKGSTYNKARFYDLVKQYHPDRHHHTSDDGIPQGVKLERYRLIVAANDILSDSAKRRAYDLYGAGWLGKPDMQNLYRESDRSWRQQPGNASMNATWEDWERWYNERDGKKQEPVFLSNEGFVYLVLVFAMIGGAGQVLRAGKHHATILELRDQSHDETNKELRHRQVESANLSREGRVESFLRQREGWDICDSTRYHLPQGGARE